MNKLFDLRFVIGLFFTIIAVLLLVYSFLGGAEAASPVNRWSGAVFGIFGVGMMIASKNSD